MINEVFEIYINIFISIKNLYQSTLIPLLRVISIIVYIKSIFNIEYFEISFNRVCLLCFRLIAEKINKNERKNKAEIIMVSPKDETMEFWRSLGGPPDDVNIMVGMPSDNTIT